MGDETVSKWDRRHIVAWDGEGANLETGKHIYNLLANSHGKYILNHDGLTTQQCFDYFLKYSNDKAINVIYGGSYDVNMILITLQETEDKLRRLWQTGTCFWKGYAISYSHRKRFSVSQLTRRTNRRIRNFVLWDVLGYFQSSFVKACRKWLGEDFAGQMQVFDEIQAMKDKEGWFFVCDPKNARRSDEAFRRISHSMNNRKKHQFSSYNGKTIAYVTKAKRHGR